MHRDDDDDLEEAYILDEIAAQIHRLWYGRPWCKHVRDVERQWKYIQAMRAKYVFPDYLALDGEPTEHDFTEHCTLTTKRQAELLLLGAYNWQGYTIARHPAVFGFERRFGSGHWMPSQRGWYATTDPIPNKLSFKNFFKPFAHLTRQRLECAILDGMSLIFYTHPTPVSELV